MGKRVLRKLYKGCDIRSVPLKVYKLKVQQSGRCVSISPSLIMTGARRFPNISTTRDAT